MYPLFAICTRACSGYNVQVLRVSRAYFMDQAKPFLSLTCHEHAIISIMISIENGRIFVRFYGRSRELLIFCSAGIFLSIGLIPTADSIVLSVRIARWQDVTRVVSKSTFILWNYVLSRSFR